MTIYHGFKKAPELQGDHKLAAYLRKQGALTHHKAANANFHTTKNGVIKAVVIFDNAAVTYTVYVPDEVL